MDFDLSEEQQLLQETVGQFLENECPMSRLRELFDDDSGYDPVLWKGLAEMGLAGIHLPGDFGGSELEILDLAVVSETLGANAAPVPFLGHALATEAINRAGNDEQRARMLPSLASGEHLATVAFAEDGGVWLPEQWTLAAALRRAAVLHAGLGARGPHLRAGAGALRRGRGGLLPVHQLPHLLHRPD